jgi:hypothetical protein
MVTTTDDAPDPTASSRMPGVVVAYNELVKIRTQQAQLLAKLDGALVLRGDVDALAARVSALEQADAVEAARKGAWQQMRMYLYGAATAVIGGGALTLIPQLWAALQATPH